MEKSSSGTSAPEDNNQINVMLVDDSSVVRGFISRILETDPEIAITGTASNGKGALIALDRANPDIVILDVEMPIMSGLEVLPELLKRRPGLKVIMCSTLTQKNATTTMRALELGAVDCIGKPSAASDINADATFRQNLLHMVRNIGMPNGRRSGAAPKPGIIRTRPLDKPAPAETAGGGAAERPGAIRQPQEKRFTLNQDSYFTGRPNLIAIGSSTGGPQALLEVMPHLHSLDVPIIITQHMPATFTKLLAKHITDHSGVTCHEAENGLMLLKGEAILARGGYHMILRSKPTGTFVYLDDGPQENYCKPAVDPMLRSAQRIYGSKILTVILTGMGQDGLEGCRSLTAIGGRLIAQDEATSVVWGMPGAVAMAGLCHEVLPIGDIGPRVRYIATGTLKR